MVIVRNANLMERDVQIGRIAAKACGAIMEDTAVLVRELGVRVR